MRNIIKKVNDKVILFYSFLIIITMLNTNVVFAAPDLLNNPITKGVQKLLEDGVNLLMIIATGALPFLIGFYALKKKFCDDEMEGKQYIKKIKVVIACYIGIMGVSIIVSLINSYFKLGGTAV